MPCLTDWWMFGATLFSGLMSVAAIVYTESRTAKRFGTRLCFALDKEYDPDLNSLGIKTNPSGYRLICQNIGQTPVFIQSIEFVDNGNFQCLLCPTDSDLVSAIKPYESRAYPINNQEFSNIEFYCETKKADWGFAVATLVGQKRAYKAKLDLSAVRFMVELREPC